MKLLFFLILIGFSFGLLSVHRVCSSNPKSTDSLLAKLKIAQGNTDEYYQTHPDNLIGLAKVPGVDTLREIKDTLPNSDNSWPDKIDYSFQLLKNTNGNIVYFGRLLSIESPYSLQIYIHYFDERGNTYAFRKKVVAVLEGIRPKLVIDDHLWYYDEHFNAVGETDTVRDSYDQQVIKLNESERKQIEFKYDVYKNLNSYIKGNKIKLKD